MTQIVPPKTRLDQAAELISQLSLDEIKQLFQRVPILNEQPTYAYLEARPHRWRKQLYLKGRNITVAQLIYPMRANNLSAEDAAYQLDLPIEQVKEAQLYYQRNKALIEHEADEEKRRLIERGYSLEPINLP